MVRVSVFAKTASSARSRRILALVPSRNAGSDASDSTSSDGEVKTPESSPAPSLDSSIERLNILDSCDESADKEEDQIQAALSPVLDAVFPNPTQCNYDALPSISSIPSLPSVQSSTMQSTSSPVVTRTQRKRSVPTVVARKIKRTCIKKIQLSFCWKNVPFKHKAEIQNLIFQEDVPIDWSPLDYFYRFFPKEMVASITDNTNLYSVQKTGKSIKVSNDEILDFLAINVIMGIVVMPSYKDYWSTSFHYSKVAQVMSLKRFQQIRRFIHFTDNSQADLQDRYYKLRPLIDYIRTQCLLVEEENAYSIDEMIIPYKGKKAGCRRQYNPNKPSKWGFKNLVRAGVSGIIYDFLLYAGDDTFRGIQFSEEEESLGLGSKIVIALCKTVKNKGSVVYFDNYFTSNSTPPRHKFVRSPLRKPHSLWPLNSRTQPLPSLTVLVSLVSTYPATSSSDVTWKTRSRWHPKNSVCLTERSGTSRRGKDCVCINRKSAPIWSTALISGREHRHTNLALLTRFKEEL
ncbi:unnamed protein product [Euphydryas editha]|uniref:PiggyBac transposable element-derived protein domain-containing protein n=1 Tax=Euphydryas editha TaxID=104508 RepID=A0AAU9V2T0_EUPED|nr:unnamed protein product [Euphydryas editha]